MDEPSFHYESTCSAPGCSKAPRYKIAAPWSYGPLRELKNYGLACDEHRESLLERARGRRDGLAVRDDEEVGPVEAYPFEPAPLP